MANQLPGTVIPENVVIYEFAVGGERVVHVIVTGVGVEYVHEAPPGETVTYVEAREHWFVRRNSAALIDALLNGNAPVRLRVLARGTPNDVAQTANLLQHDSRVQFLARGDLSQDDWTRGKPSPPAVASVTLEGLDEWSQRKLTVRLEIKKNAEKLTRAAWHSITDTPDAFFNGDPQVGDGIELVRISNDPWASGDHYYYDEAIPPNE